MPSKKLCVAALVASMSSLIACSNGPSLPPGPVIQVSPTGLYFNTDIGEGTCDSTILPGSLQITNGGQNPLKVTAVTLSGASQFTLLGPSVILADGGTQAGAPVTILSEGSPTAAFAQVTFAPPIQSNAECYTGTLTIASNATNAKSGVTTVQIQGAGIPFTLYGCPYPDGGEAKDAGPLEPNNAPVCPYVAGFTDGG